MWLLLNTVAIATIVIVYSGVIASVQAVFVFVGGAAGMRPTRSLAAGTSFVSSFVACSLAVTLHEWALRYLGTTLSFWPIAIWGFAHTLGAARTFGNYRFSLVQSGEMILQGGDGNAPRFVFFGQCYGLVAGLIAVMLAHFLYW
jgi:hypothetical protein